LLCLSMGRTEIVGAPSFRPQESTHFRDPGFCGVNPSQMCGLNVRLPKWLDICSLRAETAMEIAVFLFYNDIEH